jgi:hypothetical protein
MTKQADGRGRTPDPSTLGPPSRHLPAITAALFPQASPRFLRFSPARSHWQAELCPCSIPAAGARAPQPSGGRGRPGRIPARRGGLKLGLQVKGAPAPAPSRTPGARARGRRNRPPRPSRRRSLPSSPPPKFGGFLTFTTQPESTAVPAVHAPAPLDRHEHGKHGSATGRTGARRAPASRVARFPEGRGRLPCRRAQGNREPRPVRGGGGWARCAHDVLRAGQPLAPNIAPTGGKGVPPPQEGG